MSKLSIEAIMKEDAIIKAMVTDLAGGFKEIIFPSKVLKELIEVGIAYDGSSFQGINVINSSDAILQGVEETLVQCSDEIADTEKTEYWIICNILNARTRAPHANCARSKLVELQSSLSKVWDGGKLFMGSEPEAFFVEKKEGLGSSDGGNSNYFNPKDPKAFIITKFVNVLSEMGYDIERAHTEVGEDQFETNWRFDKAERTADRIQMYKLITHKVASNYGYDVTFLPKPYPTRNGSGMHCHLSVQNDKSNLFYDAKAKDKKFFSATSLYFLQGILDNIRAIAAVGNKAEVSYSRLVPGFEAPCVIAIGEWNRSAACRIPAIADEKIMAKALRTEFRFPDPLANPYLLAAAFIGAGIAGIEEKYPFKGFTDENLYALDLKALRRRRFKLLPRNLWEAYNEFTSSKVMKEKLGASIHESYADIVLDEIDACQPHANAESMRRHYFA